eukprot:205278-Chlamydomonas_euryale.AAC.1
MPHVGQPFAVFIQRLSSPHAGHMLAEGSWTGRSVSRSRIGAVFLHYGESGQVALGHAGFHSSH